MIDVISGERHNMSIDVVTVNPVGIDYPYWRWEMKKQSPYFGKIINGLYQDNRTYNFRDFIMENTPWADSIDVGDVTHGDWRNFTIHPCLEKSDGDWVLFLEQDFVATDNFWAWVMNEYRKYDVVGFTDVGNTGHESDQTGQPWEIGIRLHPAFILVKRELIDKTGKDFGAHPENDRDHFGTFTDDLRKLTDKRLDLYTVPGWKHYAGVYSNYMLVQRGQPPNFRVDDFKEFVKMSMEVPVPQDPRFLKWSKDCLNVKAIPTKT